MALHEKTKRGQQDDSDAPLVQVRDLNIEYALDSGLFAKIFGLRGRTVRALKNVSFDLRRGEVLGLVGESGSGKTTLGKALLGMAEATSGTIRLNEKEITGNSRKQWRKIRRHAQMVFQDPHASLNPSMDVATAVGHPLIIHGYARTREETLPKVEEALTRVGLSPASRFAGMRPSELSGGQKQRVVLARAIILNPDLIVADEPVSMLDVSVKAKMLSLMIDLKEKLGFSYIYISHDLASARLFCDRIAIMYLGEIVEIGTSGEIFANPKHPYTQALLNAVPDVGQTRARSAPRGEVPDAANPPHGCSFHPRCPMAFAPCGWSGDDIRPMLEFRWSKLAPQNALNEQALLGKISTSIADNAARVRPAQRTDVNELRQLFDRVKAEAPDEPFWRGVESVAVEGNALVFAFHEAKPLRKLNVQGREVSCHLLDDQVKQGEIGLTGSQI